MSVWKWGREEKQDAAYDIRRGSQDKAAEFSTFQPIHPLLSISNRVRYPPFSWPEVRPQAPILPAPFVGLW
jgi:hypothetical protein